MSDNILLTRAKERMALHTPSEQLEMTRQQLIAEQLRRTDLLKRRMDSDMDDVDFALKADVTNSRKRGFE